LAGGRNWSSAAEKANKQGEKKGTVQKKKILKLKMWELISGLSNLLKGKAPVSGLKGRRIKGRNCREYLKKGRKT